MTITLLATDIQYDFDGPEETGYPDELEVEVNLEDQEGFDDSNRQVCDQISNETGMLVLDYKLVGYSLSPAE